MNIFKKISAVFLAIFLTASSFCVMADTETTPGYKLVNTYDEEAGVINSDLYVTDGYGSVGQLGFYYNTDALSLAANVGGVLTADYDKSALAITAFVTGVTASDYTVVPTAETNMVQDLVNEENGEFFFAWYSDIGSNVDARNEDRKIATVKFIVDDEYDADDLEMIGMDLIKFATEKPLNQAVIGYSSGVYCANEENTPFRNSETARNKIVTSVDFVGLDIELAEAEYTFFGEYDYSDKKYIIEMYYNGPKANMTAFGLDYNTEVLTNLAVNYSAVKTTGTHTVEDTENGIYIDVVYPREGGTFGDDLETPLLIATLTFDMTSGGYGAFKPSEDFTRAYSDNDIAGAYKNGEWQYIKNSDDFSLNIAAHVHPIAFAELVDDKDITITVEGVNSEITTEVVAPTDGKMLEGFTFTAVTAQGEEAGEVTLYVDGVAEGVLEAGDDGVTYTVPAEKVLGDIKIEFSYGEPIQSVTVTDIAIPVVLKTPDITATIPSDVPYDLDKVEWFDAEGNPVEGNFGFDTVYTVKVTIKADDDYAFTGNTVYTIDGNEATVRRIDADTVELSYTYPATGKELGKLTVEAGLVRAEDKAAYRNFGTITVKNGNEIVATYTEEEIAGNKLAAEFELLAGTYTVEIAKNGYLTATLNAEIAYKETTELEVELIAGNLYDDAEAPDDGEINLLDFGRVIRAFTADTDITDRGALEDYRELVDIDEDGDVTIFDLAHVKAKMVSDGYAE